VKWQSFFHVGFLLLELFAFCLLTINWITLTIAGTNPHKLYIMMTTEVTLVNLNLIGLLVSWHIKTSLPFYYMIRVGRREVFFVFALFCFVFLFFVFMFLTRETFKTRNKENNILLFWACLPIRLNFHNMFNHQDACQFPPISFRRLFMMEINNLSIFFHDLIIRETNSLFCCYWIMISLLFRL
jgi:hypothetical protein